FPLASIAAELRDAAEVHDATATLDPFGGSDRVTDVRAAFSWSCRALNDDAARLFRLLGLHPGHDITVHAAASLVGLPSGQARRCLADLAHANLLLETAPGRYSLHDLLRAYATELTYRHDDEEQRQTALHRLLDYYLQVAHKAAALLNPHCGIIDIAPAQPGV